MDKIIAKYLSGTANRQEKELLLEWLENSEANARLFSDLQHTWALNSSIKKQFAESVSQIPEFSQTPKPAETPEITETPKPAETPVSAAKQTITRKPTRKTILIRISSATAAAAIILVAYSIFMNMQRKIESYEKDITYMLSQAGSRYEYSTPYGVKGKVTLPDGSNVWLNSGSKIEFPAKFGSESRDVSFSGEGYFEVQSNRETPMIITLNSGLEVNVLGTSFNLSSYDNDDNISLLLINGNVNISNPKGKEQFTVLPNEKVTINLSDKRLSRNTPLEKMPTIGWKSGWLIFEEAPLEEVFKKMERWYGQKIVVRDKSIYNKKLTAKFHEESASQVFDLMKQISLINYKIEDSTAIIYEFK